LIEKENNSSVVVTEEKEINSSLRKITIAESNSNT
jgi:hypothetical protein